MKTKSLVTFIFAFVLSLGWSLAWADHVRLRPLGTNTGEFCRNDRAILFVDHDGTTILYDAGRSVAGSGDPRLGSLGDVDGVLLTSVHDDHLGDFYTATDTGTCADPAGTGVNTATTPDSNTAEIAVAHGAKVPVGGEMGSFLASKGAATQTLRPGGERIIGSVKISVVQALHSNGVSTKFLTDRKEPSELDTDNLKAYVGPDHGYVLTFANGLVVYMSADTGPTSDMATVVRDFYGAQVAVIHLGSTFGNTPEAGAFAVNQLLKPRTAIVEHVNTASTPITLDSKVLAFIDAVSPSIDVIVPFSWEEGTENFEISCDGTGNCTQTLPAP